MSGVKKITGGAGAADHAISVYGGIGEQQSAGNNTNTIASNGGLPQQAGGKRRKTGKRKSMKKGKRTTVKNSQQVIAYCLKCKAKRTMKTPNPTKTKNNRNALKGNCVKCGTKMMKFV
jgi:hypothetical protein